RRLRLIDAAAAHGRKHEDDEYRNDQADDRRYEDDSRERRAQRRSEQQQPGPLDRESKTDDRQTGIDADQNRDQQEQLLFGQQRFRRPRIGCAHADGLRCWNISSTARSSPCPSPHAPCTAVTASEANSSVSSTASGSRPSVRSSTLRASISRA